MKARNDGIKRVTRAVAAWNDATAATGWSKFQQLNASVVLTVPSTTVTSPTCQAINRTVLLSPSNCPVDQYMDEAGRFQSVKQLSFCASVNWAAVQTCNAQASFLVQQPGSTGAPTSLTTLSNPVGGTAGNVIIRMKDVSGPNNCGGNGKCYGTDFTRCRSRCEGTFGGSFSCSSSGYTCSTFRTYVSSLAIKVQYRTGNSTPFTLDTINPSLGPGSGGANAVPSGFTWYKPLSTSGSPTQMVRGAAWAYEGLAYVNAPGSLTLQVRSSSDPWLAYMAATGGSGYFSVSKGLAIGVGSALMGLGGVCLLFVLFFGSCVCWGRKLAREHPTDKPKGCASGIAWTWGRLMLDPQAQPHNAVAPMAPVAQPVATAPPPGGYYYPPQGAPPPAGTPPPAGGYYQYPPAPPPAAAYPPAPAPAPGYPAAQPPPAAPGTYYADPAQQQQLQAQQQPPPGAYGAPASYYAPPAQQPGAYGAPAPGYPPVKY